jgi:hypothetical protein
MANKEVADTVTFFGCQDNNLLLSFNHHFNISLGGQHFTKLFNDPVCIDRSCKLRSHEKSIRFFLDELPVADDVQGVIKKNFGDMVDQTFAVFAGDQEDVGVH